MRIITGMLLTAFVLTSCAPGPTTFYSELTLPQVALTAPVANLISFKDAGPLASYGGSPVLPLFAIPGIQTTVGPASVDFWGTKDASGNITQLTQAGIATKNGTVHVFFDTSERPIFFHDDGTGYGFRLSYDSAAQQTLTLCDPSGIAIASSKIAISNGNAVAGGAFEGGSCALGATAALVKRAAAGGVATNPASSVDIGKLITAGAYVAGFGFAALAIAKFKGHKDNATTPISQPILLLFVAAALIFAPLIFKATGATLFDSFPNVEGVDGLVPFDTSAP